VSKIIVGVDDSERSKDAVALAGRLARGTDAELMLVCVYPYQDLPSRVSNADYARYVREDAIGTLDRAAAELPDALQIHTRAIPDISPPRAIQELATREAASLIVIGSSHRGAVGRVLAGTTAERLLHGAPCPVAVAPSGYAHDSAGFIGTIAVGYDGEPEAEVALDAAVAVARAHGARLRVIEVADSAWMGTPALMSGPGFVLQPDDLRERVRKHVTDRVAALPEDIAAQPQVLLGDPEHLLAAQSSDADLFVVGSRGYGPHRAVLLGSVSGRLVRDAACPVLVVPRGVTAPLASLFPVAPPVQSAADPS
jgi:nucleotide-binding universal stress UspA family protein